MLAAAFIGNPYRVWKFLVFRPLTFPGQKFLEKFGKVGKVGKVKRALPGGGTDKVTRDSKS